MLLPLPLDPNDVPGRRPATALAPLRRNAAARFALKLRRLIVAAFQEHRWDLEEEAEALIRDGQEDAQGWIWLS